MHYVCQSATDHRQLISNHIFNYLHTIIITFPLSIVIGATEFNSFSLYIFQNVSSYRWTYIWLWKIMIYTKRSMDLSIHILNSLAWKCNYISQFMWTRSSCLSRETLETLKLAISISVPSRCSLFCWHLHLVYVLVNRLKQNLSLIIIPKFLNHCNF